MKAINSYLPTLNSGATSLIEAQLVILITKKMSKQWKAQFKLPDGHKMKKIVEAQKKLRLLEKDENHHKQIKSKE